MNDRRVTIPLSGARESAEPGSGGLSESLWEECRALNVFRILAAEFSELPDAEVCIWLDMTVPLVSERFFRAMYEQALVLLCAHRLKMAQKAQALADGEYEIASISEDGASETYQHERPNIDAGEGSLRLTKYGQMYLEIRDKMVVGPVGL